jgi:hypothetical protein
MPLSALLFGSTAAREQPLHPGFWCGAEGLAMSEEFNSAIMEMLDFARAAPFAMSEYSEMLSRRQQALPPWMANLPSKQLDAIGVCIMLQSDPECKIQS